MTTRKGGPAKAEETGPPNNVNTRQGNGNTYYNYTDEAGEPLFRVVRRPGKKFHQERWDSGGWRLGLKGTRRALYNLPAVKAAAERGHPVFVVPGEKDADRLNALDGVTATTNPLGEGRNNWRDEYSRALVGVKGAFVVWDRDDPGRAHALRVADSLKRAGVPVRFRRALVGKDAYDHLEAGHGLSELVRQRPRDPRPTPAAKDPADPTPAEPLAAEPAVYQLALIRLREHATEHDLAQPRASDTGWECCCPAHDDHRASLGCGSATIIRWSSLVRRVARTRRSPPRSVSTHGSSR